jgi:prevent-host-death family protein
MRTITAGQLRARLGEMLDDAAAGERIIIERDHHPIAAIVPIEDTWQLEDDTEEARRRTLAVLDEIQENGRLMNKLYPPDADWEGAAAWIRWDRDHGHEHEG